MITTAKPESQAARSQIRILFLLVVLWVCLAQSAAADVYVDGAAVGAGPYYLEIEGETYVLTEDISTPGSAFVFAANNVTLDLNQHTVTFGTSSERYRYGIAMPPFYPHSAPEWAESDIEIWRNNDDAVVLNGSVVQGAGRGPDCATITARGNDGLTIENMSLLIYGDDTFAVKSIYCKDIRIQGNVLTDSTTVVTNRHQGRAAIDIIHAIDGPIEIFDNTIHNCRHFGIRITREDPVTVWAHIFGNQIYPNTIVTNGYGIGCGADLVEVYENTIQAENGRGIHVANGDRALVHGNFVEVVNPPFWDEYSRVSAHGIKLENCTNAEVYANHVISKGLVESLDAVSNGTALNLTVDAGSNNWVHDNTFEARHLGGAAFDPSNYGQFASAIEVIMIQEESGLRIENNTFVTNDRFFCATDWRGPDYPDPISAEDISIVGNTWLREGTAVPTQKYDIFFTYSSVTDLTFVDNTGEADFQNYGTGWPWKYCSWGVGHTGTVRTLDDDGSPVPATEVEVRNVQGMLVANPITDGLGEANLALEEFVASSEGNGGDEIFELIDRNPYDFTALFPGDPQSEQTAIVNPGWEVEIRSGPVSPPIADFEGTPTSGNAPLTVDFLDQSLNGPASWSWDFGDGGTSSQRNPSYTYDDPGTYTVSLTVTNAAGEDTETKFNYITVTEPPPPDPPVAEFEGTPRSGDAPLEVDFTDQSTNTPTSWSWTFGDGGTSSQQNPTYVYDDPGVYSVSLTVSNAGGGDTETKTNYITVSEALPPPPVAEFAGTPRSGDAPLTVDFADQSINSPTSWSWTFGDGGTSSQQNPTYIYDDPGVYNVSLTVSNAGGGDTETKTNYITVSEALPPPPVAEFGGTPRSGEAPLEVDFTDQSTNDPTSWSWTFGDGGTSSQQNPTYIYDDPGVYNVSLTASNAGGGDTETKSNYITVTEPPPPPPVAEFEGNPRSGDAPVTVDFTDQSTNSPTSWSWTFGDGGTSLQQSPSYTYDDPGIYTVTLTATNAGGEDTETKTNYITVAEPPPPPDAPVAEFEGTPTSGDAPLTVDFTDQSTNEPTSWSWTFGDGGSSAQQNPSHTYDDPGIYTVTLTATNAGGEDSETKVDYITVTDPPPPPPDPPIAEFAGTPTSGDAPLTVDFTDLSTNIPSSWSWTFGDGGLSALQNPSYTYDEPGIYTVTLTATNAGGEDTETKVDYITVTDPPPPPPDPPVAEFEGAPTSGDAPLTVDFTDQSTDGPTTWSWTFGDGGTSLLPNPSYTYDDPGVYTVTLTATNAGGEDTETKVDYITVTDPPPPPPDAPVAEFDGTPTSGEAPLTVDFTDLSTNIPSSWSWTFGDGGLSALQNPSYTYDEPGIYTVTLTATNAGGEDTETKVGYITVTDPPPPPPVADFEGTPTSGDAPLTVEFTDQSTSGPTSWSWTFGDGGLSVLQNPSHTYDDPGIYTVTLTATNAGGEDTETKVDYITVTDPPPPPPDPPVAEFEGAPTSGDAPLTVDFTDQSTNGPTSWSWTFGDGGSSAQQNPSYTYDDPGTYTASLTVTNEGGEDTETKVDYITVTEPPPPPPDAPVADFEGTPTSGEAPLTVDFTDQSTSGPTTWSWTFGDGGTSLLQNPSYTYDDPGAYTVTLTVTNAGGEDTETKVDYITVTEPPPPPPDPPVAEFTATPTSGVVPTSVEFTDSSTNDPHSWSWDFGDGEISTEQNPVHTYRGIGRYTVTLTATNPGGQDRKSKLDFIRIDQPTPRQVHISNLILNRAGEKFVSCIAAVSVVDQDGLGVPDAGVWGVFDSHRNKTLFGITGSSGVAILQSKEMRRPPTTWCFEVTNITIADAEYDPSSNVLSSRCNEYSDPLTSAPDYSTLSLYPGQPNPFRSETAITFSIPQSGHVALEVFNLEGKSMGLLLDEERDAGDHVQTWSPLDCPPGVYFVRLAWQGKVETKRVIHIR